MSCVICFSDVESYKVCCTNQHIICSTCLDRWVSDYVSNPEHSKKIQADASFPCPVTGDCSETISLSNIIPHISDKTKNEVLERLILKSRKSVSTRDDDHSNNILELLNKKCPHSLRVFEEFDACIAVCCDGPYGCGNHFCGACFIKTDSVEAAHEHANKVHKQLFLNKHDLKKLNTRYFRQNFWEYLKKIKSETVKNGLLTRLRPDIKDILGADFELPVNRQPPLYGINDPKKIKQSTRVDPMMALALIRAPEQRYPRGLLRGPPPPPNPEVVQLAAGLVRFRDEGIYELYIQLFKQLHLDPIREDNLDTLRYVIQINENLLRVKTFMDTVDLKKHQAERIKLFVQDLAKLKLEQIHLVSGTEFPTTIIRLIQNDLMLKIQTDRLKLILTKKDKLSAEDQEKRSSYVRDVKKILSTLDNDREIIERIRDAVKTQRASEMIIED
mgnify:CR=1 FL=1